MGPIRILARGKPLALESSGSLGKEVCRGRPAPAVAVTSFTAPAAKSVPRKLEFAQDWGWPCRSRHVSTKGVWESGEASRPRR